MGDVEVEAGDELRGAQPLPQRALAFAVALLVLLTGLLAADRWQAGRELDRLLAGVAEGESVVAASQASLSSLGDYQASLLARADAPPDARASAYANLSRDAARWVPSLERADARVAGVQVLPWHGAVRDAREAYLLRLRAWEEVLARTRTDPTRALGAQRDVGATRQAAADALVAAAGGDAPARRGRARRREALSGTGG